MYVKLNKAPKPQQYSGFRKEGRERKAQSRRRQNAYVFALERHGAELYSKNLIVAGELKAVNRSAGPH